MDIIFIRHGQTAGNALRRYIGSTDEPLSKIGQVALKSIPPFEHIKKVYVSPLVRARQTALHLFPKAAQIVVPELRETDFGDFENRSADDMADDPDYRAWVDALCETPCPNGDDPALVKARVCASVRAIVLTAYEMGEELIIIVAHGGTIMSAMERFSVPARGFYDYSVRNLGGYRAHISIENSAPVFTNAISFTDISTVL
ncbi:MAG: histidine phosphatase family protein [Clostridia bacterium]|nr:histidine phosphatase family protein [Clostridia bacterium]